MIALGTSGLQISRTGFGSWGIAGAGWRWSWGSQDDDDSVAAIRHAVRRGVNWIDTAAVYGYGHAEDIVGKAIAGLTVDERPLVFTKGGLVWDPDAPDATPRRTMKHIRREVEESLRRLGVEVIDLYQVHWPDTGEPLDWNGGGRSANAVPVEEYWQVMADLKAEGKVRAIGLSNHSTAELEMAERVAHVDAIQPPFSALNRSATREIDWARQHGTGVIVYSPMESGLLTGAFSPGRVAALPDDDWRKHHPAFTTRLGDALTIVDALRPIAARHGTTVAAVAVAWALAWPGVTGAIVGARRGEQIDGWIDANRLELTAHDLGVIAAALPGDDLRAIS
ncbi:aldo/keto reductase [Microbacterium bovistercoris]|uniref:Aldo/keto reductase n=1 Tax=Microbacterium bovistercoris TaxID=2293570 RepID=A0A371NPL1_9MICO|nr:aldo/keto reductase [Microbacterium bovistercoris]REJ04136.1 aldo/keto reductase [Microbacterium bovistercoris]